MVYKVQLVPLMVSKFPALTPLPRYSVPLNLNVSLLSMVRNLAERDPSVCAVTDDAKDTSRRQLVDRANTFVNFLGNHQFVVSANIMAVAAPRCLDTIAIFLALDFLNIIYVPIDLDWPQHRIESVLLQTGSPAVVVLGADTSRCEVVSKAAKIIGCHFLTAPNETVSSSLPPLNIAPNPQNASYILSTSGSSGHPKAAVVSRLGMINQITAKIRDLQLSELDRVAFSAPVTYSVSIWQMIAGIIAGGRTVIMQENDVSFPRRTVEALNLHKVSIFEVVPTTLSWLSEELKRSKLSLADLRYLLCTGEALSSKRALEILAILPTVRLINAYGSAECADDVSTYEVKTSMCDSGFIPIGTPLANTDLYVLVSEKNVFRSAHEGEIGELFVGGAPVGLGYQNDQILTGKAFFFDSINDKSHSGRIYKTGDLVSFKSGTLHYHGRTDRQVKVSGGRVELDEIELFVLLHAEVLSCAAITENLNGRLLVFFTADRQMSTRELIRHCSLHLPTSLVPRIWRQVSTLPLTKSGKIDRRSLLQTHYQD